MDNISILGNIVFAEKVFFRGEEIAELRFDESDFGESEFEQKEKINCFVSHRAFDLNERILSVPQDPTGQKVQIKLKILQIGDLLF